MEQHRTASGTSADGGISDRWVVIRLGRIPMPFPNTAARRRALVLHDVNHLLGGFGNGNVGEAEVSAWELASGGCGKYLAAWALDLAGMLLGMVWPAQVVRAFAAGRRTGNAYQFDIDEILDIDLEELCEVLTRDDENTFTTSVGSVALFIVLLILAIPVSAVFLVAVILSLPVWALTKDRAPVA
jgi:hypothetical protein